MVATPQMIRLAEDYFVARHWIRGMTCRGFEHAETGASRCGVGFTESIGPVRMYSVAKAWNVLAK